MPSAETRDKSHAPQKSVKSAVISRVEGKAPAGLGLRLGSWHGRGQKFHLPQALLLWPEEQSLGSWRCGAHGAACQGAPAARTADKNQRAFLFASSVRHDEAGRYNVILKAKRFMQQVLSEFKHTPTLSLLL